MEINTTINGIDRLHDIVVDYSLEPIETIVGGIDYPIYEESGLNLVINSVRGDLPCDFYDKGQYDEYIREIEENLKQL